MGRGRPKKRFRVPAEAEDEVGEEEEALLFAVGAEVEVRSDDPGFLGSFYEATVTGHLLVGGCGGYVVVYSTLEGEDGGSLLRESAAAADVRPRPPPPAPGREFAMYEMVEAFHNEGWWSGVVSAVPPPLPVAGDHLRRVYKVTFPTSREVLKFEETALRPHCVFEGGRWVSAADVDNGIPLFREGSQVEVSRSAESFGESWNPATVLKVIGAINFLVQYRHVGEDRELVTEILDSQYIRPARTIIRMDSKYRFSPSSHVEVFHEGSWWPGVILEVLGSGFIKKYVVKLNSHETDMDNVEFVDVLTVENTQLRPRFDWDGRKWVRCLTEKPAKKGPILTSRKRPISAALASCNDTDEIRYKPGCYLEKKLKNADVVSGPISPDLSVCNDNDEIKHKSSSYPEETLKQQHAVLALESQLALPLQQSMTGFGNLKYDPSLSLSSHLELSSSEMIAMPSVPQSGQLQASLFGVFGQLRPLPQGPVLGLPSLNPEFGSIEGSKKSLTDRENQSTDEGCYQMASAEQKNFNFRSFDLSRKRKECISFQTPEGLGENPEFTKKRIGDKTIEGTNNTAAISEESTKLKNSDDEELPNDVIFGSGILSEINTVSRIDPTPLKDNKGSQESSIVDKIKPSGIDDLHQGDYIGALEHGATKVSVLVDNSVLSMTSTLDNHNPREVNVFYSDSSTEYGIKATKADKCAISVEEDTAEEFCERLSVIADNAKVNLLPSAKSCEAAGHDHELCKDNMASMVECVTSCVVPTEKNCEANNKGDMDKVDPRENVAGLANNRPETQLASVVSPFSDTSLAVLKGDILTTQSSTKKFAANEQHGVSQQDCSSAMVECAAESSQAIEKSAITQLPSVDVSNSTEAELGNSLTIPEDIEGTPISKYVANRTYDPCCPLLLRSLVVHETIMADRPSDSLTVENLPFVKTSPMWAQIEAMEIFTKLPQQPNFHQFQQHVPDLREGMALGLMFSFANLAESIRRLNIQDENSLFEDKMEGLSLLEADGFDVRDLRSRLETLLHIKNGHIALQDAVKKLEEKIAHKEIDDQQLGTQIGMLHMAVRQLELQAYLFRSIKQSAISQKTNNAKEISRLKTAASEIERSYLSAEQRFSSAAAAPW